MISASQKNRVRRGILFVFLGAVLILMCASIESSFLSVVYTYDGKHTIMKVYYPLGSRFYFVRRFDLHDKEIDRNWEFGDWDYIRFFVPNKNELEWLGKSKQDLEDLKGLK